jgi:hypothetical protein
MKRTQIQLTGQQLEALRQLSAETGKSVAELVREGVDLYLSRRNHVDREELVRRALSIVGKYSSGQSDVARNHDKYLAEDFLS